MTQTWVGLKITMSISIAPTDLLPVIPDQALCFSVRIDNSLLKRLDPAMDPVTTDDTFTRAWRKGNAAMDRMEREISIALFGTATPRLKMDISWPDRALLSGPRYGYKATTLP